MIRNPGPLRIATRRSRLALWQAEHVKERLEALYGAPGSLQPGLRVELVPLSTRGDELLDVSLAKAGGSEEEPYWNVVLAGLEERLPVSRRQWPAVKSVLPEAKE